MRLRENDIGLLWNKETGEGLPARTVRPARSIRVDDGNLRPMPVIDWFPPAELPVLPRTGELCVDVETRDPEINTLGPGVRRPGNYVVGLAIGTDDGRRWYFPVRHEGGGNLDERIVWAWAREELNAFRGTIVGAKLAYDLDWLAENGVTFPLVECFDDVQVAEPLLDEQRYEFNLDALATDYLGERKVEGRLHEAALLQGWKTEREIKQNLWRLPASYVGAYAEGDVDLPLRIIKLQRPKLEAEELLPVWNIERQLVRGLVDMTRRGVRVDAEGAIRVREELGKVRDRLIAEMRRIAGPKAELMIPDSFVAALRTNGHTIPLTPKDKKPSIRKEWLLQRLNDPLCAAIFNARKVNTLINTFIDGNILGHHINGRIHCEWKQLKDEGGGTIARTASANPNLANIPGRDDDRADEDLREVAPLIRGLFLPDDDEDIGDADYCLTGETRIITIDGPISIKELVRNPRPVLSSRDCRSVEFQPIVAAKRMGRKKVYKLTLDDGSSVRCTADHKWMNFDGAEVLTKNLSHMERLAHVHDGISGTYPTWYVRSNRIYWKKHRLVAAYAFGEKPDGYDTDHIDGERMNWVRDNLHYLPITKNRGQGGKRWWDAANKSLRAKKVKDLVDGQKNRRSYAGKENPNFGNTGHLSNTRWASNGSITKRIVGKLPKGWRLGRSSTNHKVVSVVADGYAQTYHIEVAGSHTYVLENGLISHNSQIEYRLLTHFAIGPGAEEARRSYRDDPKTDYHKMCATLCGIDPEDSKRRKMIKGVNFARTYGAQANKLASLLGVSKDEAERFIELYDEKLPFNKATFNAAQKYAEKHGFVRSILRRRQHFNLWEPKRKNWDAPETPLRHEAAIEKWGIAAITRYMSYAALNRKMQSSNADILKKSMVDAAKRGITKPDALGAFLLTVYDSLTCSIPRTARGREAWRELYEDVMPNAVKLSVPVLVTTKVGKTWGECI